MEIELKIVQYFAVTDFKQEINLQKLYHKIKKEKEIRVKYDSESSTRVWIIIFYQGFCYNISYTGKVRIMGIKEAKQIDKARLALKELYFKYLKDCVNDTFSIEM